MASLNLALHQRQTFAFESRATEILYGGAAGGGKSHLMRIAAILWCSNVPGLQVYIFRRLSDDLLKNHMEGPSGFPALLAEWMDAGYCKINWSRNFIEFWNGAKIHLCHCQYEKDVTKYQGAEIHVLMIDELTHFTETIYRYLRARCRIGGLVVPKGMTGQFPRTICGSNPGGIGHNWVKATFIDIAEPQVIVKQPKDQGGMLRQYVPAKLSDNPTLAVNDPDYADRLSGLGSPELVRAMLEGDWNIVAGGALDDVWTTRVVVPRFTIPHSWRVDRSFDWGSSHPFAVSWFAEADGTEATLDDGSKWGPPRGTLILCHEWYGASGVNTGLKMSPRDVAKGINERETSLVASRWMHKPIPGPADNQISAVSQPGTPTIADEMAQEGVRWTTSDKAPGTRKIGLELLRSRIKEAGKDRPEHPSLYVMAHCRAAIAQLPVLPRDAKNPDDVDTNSEDHLYDAIRYRVLAAKSVAMSIPLKMAY
jgi:hypothetical protein